MTTTPISMLLFCPKCGFQHVDAPEPDSDPPWLNEPHRSHRCKAEACGHIWRPSDHYTVGVAALETRGAHDGTPIPGLMTFDKRAADALADEVAVLIRLRKLDARSPAGDALLDYRDPPTTPRADRMAELERLVEGTRAMAARIAHEVVESPDSAAWAERILDEGAMSSLEHLAELTNLLRKVRPFVAMAPSMTSGREFRENVEAILTKVDKALDMCSPTMKTPTMKPTACEAMAGIDLEALRVTIAHWERIHPDATAWSWFLLAVDAYDELELRVVLMRTALIALGRGIIRRESLLEVMGIEPNGGMWDRQIIEAALMWPPPSSAGDPSELRSKLLALGGR